MRLANAMQTWANFTDVEAACVSINEYTECNNEPAASPSMSTQSDERNYKKQRGAYAVASAAELKP